MDTAKDTRKQEKQRIAIAGSGGAVVALGGVAVVAALAVASVSVFKFRKTGNRKTTRAAADELNKGNEEADITSAENGAQPLEIIGKMREDETYHENEPLNENKEKSIEDTLTDRVTQNDHLAKYQVNPQEIEAEEEYEAITVVPKTPYVEAKFIETKEEVPKTPHDEVEYKQEEDEALIEDEAKSGDGTATDHVTQNDHLAKYQVNPQVVEAEVEHEAIVVISETPEVEYEEEEDEATMVVPTTPQVEVEENEALNKDDEEKTEEDSITDHVSQKQHLAKYQVNQEQVEGEATTVVLKAPHTEVEYQEEEKVAAMVVPKTPLVEVEYKEEEDETLNEDGEKSGEGSIDPQEIEAEEEEGAILVVPKVPNVEIEYKEEDNKALNEDEERSDKDTVADHATQKDHLTKYQVNPQEIEAKEEDEAIKVVLESTQVEVEYKEEKDGALNEDEKQNGEDSITDHVTPKNHLAKYQVNPQELEAEEDDEAIMVVPRTPHVEYKNKENEPIMVVPEVPHVEVEYKEGFGREQGYEHGEDVKKDQELAEEIEVDTQSDENSSIDEDGGDIAEKVAQIQHMEKEQEEHNGDEIVKREERAIEMAPQLNRYATEDELEVTEEESVHVEEEQEYGEGKSTAEKEKESGETNEDDDEEEEEETESSEGTGDSSVESNIDAVWPVEAVNDILMEIKQRKIDNQISDEKTEDYVKVEAEEKSLKNDNVYATNCCEIEDSGKSVLNSKKRYIKELLLELSNTRIWIWAILVLVLALAALLVLSVGGVTKLFLVVFFVVGLYRVLQTITS